MHAYLCEIGVAYCGAGTGYCGYVSTDEGYVGDDRTATEQVASFRHGFLVYESSGVNEALDGLKSANRNFFFTHSCRDLHQDHLVVSDPAWNMFWDHNILEDEIPKYNGHRADPTFWCSAPTASGGGRSGH